MSEPAPTRTRRRRRASNSNQVRQSRCQSRCKWAYWRGRFTHAITLSWIGGPQSSECLDQYVYQWMSLIFQAEFRLLVAARPGPGYTSGGVAVRLASWARLRSSSEGWVYIMTVSSRE